MTAPGAAPRHIGAEALRLSLTFETLVPALRAMFAAGCHAPQRQHLDIGHGGTVLVMPAWQEGRHFGIKTVTVFPGNGSVGLPSVQAVYALFDACNGQPLAVLDGGELTARRTAAVSALAADFLARADVRRMVLLGAGQVGTLLPRAMRAVRPGLREVAVWNRSRAGAQRLANELRAEGWRAEVVTDLATAVRSADIVSCATLSTAALVQGAWLARGSHLDLVGSYAPAMRESDGECLARGRVFVDTEEALLKSGDLLQAVSEGRFAPTQLQGTLAALCRGEVAGREGAGEITVFKSVGTALADLTAAGLALQASTEGAAPA